MIIDHINYIDCGTNKLLYSVNVKLKSKEHIIVPRVNDFIEIHTGQYTPYKVEQQIMYQVRSVSYFIEPFESRGTCTVSLMAVSSHAGQSIV